VRMALARPGDARSSPVSGAPAWVLQVAVIA